MILAVLCALLAVSVAARALLAWYRENARLANKANAARARERDRALVEAIRARRK